MDYEKKYKEALEKARQLCAYPTTKSFISDLQDLFPELKESEDERIRGAIIDFFKYEQKEGIVIHHYGVNIERIIAWLEKQGEQKTTNIVWHKVKPKEYVIEKTLIIKKSGEVDIVSDTLLSVTDAEYALPLSCLVKLLKCGTTQKEQKPEWSEEDEKIYQSILDDTVQENQLCDKQTNWLKSLKDRTLPQPKQEWSEADERVYRSITYAMEHNFPLNSVQQNFVKSLRSKKHWKPSEEQMIALLDSFQVGIGKTKQDMLLESLYEQLKAL